MQSFNGQIFEPSFSTFFSSGFSNLRDEMNTNPNLPSDIFEFFSFDFGYWIFQVFLFILFIFQLFDPCGRVFNHNLDIIFFIHVEKVIWIVGRWITRHSCLLMNSQVEVELFVDKQWIVIISWQILKCNNSMANNVTKLKSFIQKYKQALLMTCWNFNNLEQFVGE